MLPSVNAIAETLKIDREKAKKVRAIMEDPEKLYYEKLEAIDPIIGTFGVESIPAGHNAKSPAITYCNTGDTYGATVMVVRGGFRLGCWGDIVERGHYD